MLKVIVINGPNINLIEKRERNIYGMKTLENIKCDCLYEAEKLNLQLDFHQTNSESQIIDLIHSIIEKYDGLIINAAAYSHTSIAIMDALLILDIPIIEVHLSNILRREQYRHKSYIAKVAQGVICGFNGYGYILALYAMHNILLNLDRVCK